MSIYMRKYTVKTFYRSNLYNTCEYVYVVYVVCKKIHKYEYNMNINKYVFVEN